MSVQTFATNAANDLYVDADGNLPLVSGQSAVAAVCSNVSKALLGEEVLNQNNGIPFFQAVFVAVPNLTIFEAYLRAALLTVPGVTGIPSIASRISVGQNSLTRLNERSLDYTATIENQFGASIALRNSLPIQR